jgi:glycosyltransferase involved in cell wall biosynthesis
VSAQIALVQWHGLVGGTETSTAALAQRLWRLGVDAQIVFIGNPDPVSGRLVAGGTPYQSLRYRRGREVLLHPREYTKVVQHSGRDGALLADCGFLGPALRAGGYRAPIVAVDHGQSLFPAVTRSRRFAAAVVRQCAAWADDAEVAVSDFVLQRMLCRPHARRVRRIYHGVDPTAYDIADHHGHGADGEIVVGFVGRLIAGKGVDSLLRAIALVRRRLRVRLLIAGDGPERQRLQVLARTLGIDDRVVFVGTVDDVAGFWAGCNVACVPSDAWTEAFCMVALEAMACGKPIVTTRNGALPEVVAEDVTGSIVPPGDPGLLAEALVTYGTNADLARSHGAAGRERAARRFHIEDCARAYLALFDEIQDRWKGSG